MSTKKNVFYKQNDCEYYKINHDLKRITKISNNEVTFLNYENDYKALLGYKTIKLNVWKHIENTFFISRHFQWEYNGTRYTTTDKEIKWEKDENYGQKAFVFHAGSVWIANLSGNYYPRIHLTRKAFVNPIREVLLEKDISKTPRFKLKLLGGPTHTKWTDIKYCRHFEKIS